MPVLLYAYLGSRDTGLRPLPVLLGAPVSGFRPEFCAGAAALGVKQDDLQAK